MRWQLTVTSGPNKGEIFLVEPGQTLVIGRGEHVDVKLKDPAVSRVHLEIANLGNELMMADRGSSSGTFVNGHRTLQGALASGAKLRIGDSEMTVEEIGRQQKTTPPADGSSGGLPPVELLGKTINHYQLDSIIGVGQSGVVFLARDQNSNEQVALKILDPQIASDDEQRQRFVRAMTTMLPIRHHRIIRLLNAGKSGPYCWIAMEYIDGDSLTKVIEKIGIEGMLDWKQVWRVAVDVGLALQHGAEHAIVHRNVTPANIIRRRSDGVCLLGDFMLAKALEGSQHQALTRPGEILGEPHYLAPERTLHNGIVDSRSDIYGLGATCYALLTGRPPVAGENLGEILVNIRTAIPDPPKKYQLGIHELFQDIVMRMLAKKQEDRYQSPQEMLDDLIRIGRWNNLEIAP
ncbi:MAG TPA: FHA domain-containing serine/threonine-protein kinase [Pirellulaceae bacterium]|nr:FHA domain-containing serine/threonine-protein kinase [Pirellulaceae bacterium]